MKVALITGVGGQDDAYFAELLLEKRYMLYGINRRSSLINKDRIDHLDVSLHAEDVSFKLHYGDMTDSTNLIRVVKKIQPDEMAFAEVGVKIEFVDEGVNEGGFVESAANPEYSAKTGQEVTAIDPSYFRPTEADLLIGILQNLKQN